MLFFKIFGFFKSVKGWCLCFCWWFLVGLLSLVLLGVVCGLCGCGWLLVVCFVGWLVVGGLLLVVGVLFLMLRELLFVKFRKPKGLPEDIRIMGYRWVKERGGKWVCVSDKELKKVMSRYLVWGVRVAVVRKRIGVVLYWWVFVCGSPPVGGDHNK